MILSVEYVTLHIMENKGSQCRVVSKLFLLDIMAKISVCEVDGKSFKHPSSFSHHKELHTEPILCINVIFVAALLTSVST